MRIYTYDITLSTGEKILIEHGEEAKLSMGIYTIQSDVTRYVIRYDAVVWMSVTEED